MHVRLEPSFGPDGKLPQPGIESTGKLKPEKGGFRDHLALWIVLVLSLMVLAGGYWAWTHLFSAVGVSMPSRIAVAPRPVAPQVAEPAVKYPIAAVNGVDPGTLPAADKVDAYVADALVKLLGQRAVLSMLQTGDFVRRVVVTVDNLAREHAASGLWPVNPTPGRFSVTGKAGAQSLNPDNGLRYLPFVRIVESVDLAAGVALYVQLYPLFQRAYEGLGYPGRYFNDRLVEVIDNLLAAPEPARPVDLRITEVKGPIKVTRPWLSYEFSDPGLRSLSSGQKLLVRMGLDNERRLKSKLAEIRRLVTAKSALR